LYGGIEIIWYGHEYHITYLGEALFRALGQQTPPQDLLNLIRRYSGPKGLNESFRLV
jgi:hypothetical protein